jgi:hypothetical protein
MRRSCQQWPIATCPPELTMCLILRPFLHLGQNLAGAQGRSRCSPPRRNDLDGAEHRHTINTAGTAAPPKPHRKNQDEHSKRRCLTGKFAGDCRPLVDWPRRLTGRGFSRASHSHHVKDPD